MAAADKVFAGAMPEIYDRFLVPLIFETYAVNLAERLAEVEPHDVLEVAAGTGALTRAMALRLPAPARIIATDLNQPMLDHAAARQSDGGRITWRQADAMALPFADQQFDAVVCQFGTMFFPDKVLGYQEIRPRPEGRWPFLLQRLGRHFSKRFCFCCDVRSGGAVPAGPASFYGAYSSRLPRRRDDP